MQQNFATIEDPLSSASGPAGRPSIMAEQKKIIRTFVPFKTVLPVSATALTPLYGVGATGSAEEWTELAGVFFTGDHPCWFLGTDKTGLQTYKAAWSVVNAFTASDILSPDTDAGREFLVYSEEVCMLESPAYPMFNIAPLLGSITRRSSSILQLMLPRSNIRHGSPNGPPRSIIFESGV